MRRFARYLLALSLLLIPGFVLAQSNEEEKSTFTTFVEEQLSSPNMQISLNGLDGVLSSDVELDSITVSDKEGVWLRIVEPKLVWNRSALLRGRLEIESLSAQKIELPRTPLADESLPTPEAQPFALPELPVAVEIEKIEVGEIDIGEPVFGLAARVSVNGRIELSGGELDVDIAANRLDAPGELKIAAVYEGDPAALDMNVSLVEPAGGIVANLLNLEGDPPVALTVIGKGPVDDLNTTLAFDVDGKRIVDGNLVLERVDGVLQARTQLNGPLADILPENQRAFFGDESRINADLAFQPDGRIVVERVLLDSGATQLTANGSTLPDGFLATLNLDLRLQPAEGKRVILPGEETKTSVKSARLNLVYDAQQDGSFRAQLDATDVRSGNILVGTVDIGADGTVTDPANSSSRAIAFALDGSISKLSSSDEALAKALGERIAITAQGDWKANEPVRLDSASVTGETLELNASGAITASQFDGKLEIDASQLRAFSDVAGRPALRGQSDLEVSGTVQFLSGAFDLVLDGTATDLKLGEPQVDPLLAGETKLEGGVERSENGLSFKSFDIANDQLRATLNGNLKSDAANLTAQARLTDIGLIQPNASGTVLADIAVTGEQKPYDVRAQIRMDSGVLQGRDIDALRLTFDGRTDLESLAGALGADGTISDEPIDLAGDIDVSAKRQSVAGLSASVGETRLSGDLTRGENGLIDAKIDVDSDNIESAAALALIEATGAIKGNVTLQAQDNAQAGSADVEASGVRYGEYRLGSADIEAQFADLFGKPKINADLKVADAFAAGIDITSLDGTIETQGNTTTFDIDAALRQSTTRLSAKGTAEQEDNRTAVELTELTIDSDITDARLQQPVSVVIENGNVDISQARLDVGGGSVQLSGSAGENLDLDVVLDNLPLSIANSIRPDLKAGGTISGTAQITGTAAAPQAVFDMDGSGITAAQLSAQGIDPVSVSAEGRFASNTVTLTDAVLQAEGGTVRVTGTAGQRLDLDVVLQNLPLSLANSARPDLGAGGTLSGTAQIAGTPSAPVADFNLQGSGITVSQLRDNGIDPLQLNASGRFTGNVVTLNSADVSNGQGIAIRASGRLPVDGSGLNISADGSAPLQIADGFLVNRGASVTGRAQFDITVTGQPANPQINGLISVSDGTLTDPLSNLRLTNIGLMAGFTGDRLTIRTARAELFTGGSVEASGTVLLTGDMNADIAIRLNGAQYTDGETFLTRASGNLSLTGPLALDPLLSGRVELEKTEIAVPENFGGPGDLLEVRHVRPSPKVQRTLNRLERVRPKGTPGTRPSVLRLDVTIDAPNQIFVRGRGLDAELGGRVRVTGPVTDLTPVGQFELRRGRLSILGQRIELEEGRITLTGTLNPLLFFVARTRSATVEAIITVEGRASDLEVSFSSVPQLPEDEVLAQIIFGRSIGELSPVQIARLAAIAAELTGGNSPGLIDQLRAGTGLDNLDVTTDSEGNAAVQAGKYLSDNIYLGVQTGAETKATINLDITDDVTARGAVGTDGSSSIGIFYEKDY